MGLYLVLSSFLSHDVEALVHVLRGEGARFDIVIGEARMYPFLKHLLHAHFSAMLCQVCLVANEYYRDLKVVHLIVALGINEVVTPGSDALIAFHVR